MSDLTQRLVQTLRQYVAVDGHMDASDNDLHRKAVALLAESSRHRFAETSCSQCSCDLGPGDSGVSHCEDHARASALFPSEWLKPGAVLPVNAETVRTLHSFVISMLSAREPEATEAYFARIASNKEDSIQFLKRSGILDASGELAEPYRTEATGEAA